MYYESYGKRDRARELYREIPTARRTPGAESLRAASAVCPQGIDIAARLGEAETLLG